MEIGRRIGSILVALCAVPAHGAAEHQIAAHAWNHGSEDCSRSRDPAIEVFEADPDSYILRQSKCVHFEAPFIYVLFGGHTVLVLDTGASADAGRFPLHETVQGLVARRGAQGLALLVVHSHSHGDHTAGDAQFRGRPGVTLVEPSARAVREYFGFVNWPEGRAEVDLGGRTLQVIPVPGHQDEGIALYDSRTGWLLTGDTVYPGQVYVNDWAEYRSSVSRLAKFAGDHSVSAVLGAHIEMLRTGTLYPPASTFQPNEAPLPLTVEDLVGLDESLGRAGEEPMEIVTTKLVVSPIGLFRRTVTGVLKFIGVR